MRMKVRRGERMTVRKGGIGVRIGVRVFLHGFHAFICISKFIHKFLYVHMGLQHMFTCVYTVLMCYYGVGYLCDG